MSVEVSPTGILGFEVRSISGEPIFLGDFAGKVVLVVNTASRCGFTPQYAGLQELHETFGPRGLVVIGFPCNQFGAQEPEGEAGIARFCELNYGVDFLLTEKIEVNGPGAPPLFRDLTSACPGVVGAAAGRSPGQRPPGRPHWMSRWRRLPDAAEQPSRRRDWRRRCPPPQS